MSGQSLFDDTSLFDPGKERMVTYDLPDATLVLYEHFFSKNPFNAKAYRMVWGYA